MTSSASAAADDAHETKGNGEPEGVRTKSKDVYSEPIYGVQHVGPEWPMTPDLDKPLSVIGISGRFMADMVRKPATWIRENIVLPNKGPKYYWYHKKYPRTLPIDECYLDDLPCIYEADMDYKRIHAVDRATLELLRARRDGCHFWFTTQYAEFRRFDECQDIDDTFKREETNYHTKYGDLPANAGVLQAYNKQKCRLIVDRRRTIRKQKEETEMKHQS